VKNAQTGNSESTDELSGLAVWNKNKKAGISLGKQQGISRPYQMSALQSLPPDLDLELQLSTMRMAL
jgi:hypothetical protein